MDDMDTPPLPAESATKAMASRPALIARLVGIVGLLVVLWIVFADVAVMRRFTGIGGTVAATGPELSMTSLKGGASGIDLKWYAPNSTKVNDLHSVLGGKGVYGFTYNTSNPKGVEYGTYNWCNMPHVRKEEYKVPDKEYMLRYVEVIHRHHKRTPYIANSFPVESYPWNCDDEALYFYGQPDTGKKSGRTKWRGYISPVNPFKPAGFIGSCQFPQITKEGLEDSWQHGKDLYGVYGPLLGFLPTYVKDSIEFRVTQNQITSQVAGMIVSGMFGPGREVDLLVAPKGFDSLEPSYACKTSKKHYAAEKRAKSWTKHLSSSSTLYSTLDDISGVPSSDAGFHKSFDHYYDNLSARQCHSKPLPCKLIGGANSSNCVTLETAESVYRMGHWEYSYLYRDSPTSLNAAVGSFGVWIAELAAHMRDNISGQSKIKYRHNITHDGSLARLLSFLQIQEMVWPGMGAEVVFEMWEKAALKRKEYSKEYFLRVLYGGRVLMSSSPMLGVLDMVPLETVLAYFDGLVGRDADVVLGKCNGSIPY